MMLRLSCFVAIMLLAASSVTFADKLPRDLCVDSCTGLKTRCIFQCFSCDPTDLDPTVCASCFDDCNADEWLCQSQCCHEFEAVPTDEPCKDTCYQAHCQKYASCAAVCPGDDCGVCTGARSASPQAQECLACMQNQTNSKQPEIAVEASEPSEPAAPDAAQASEPASAVSVAAPAELEEKDL